MATPAGLPDLAAAKRYLKLEESAAEDTLVQELLDRAYGDVEAYLNVPIVARAETFVVDGRATCRRALVVPAAPIDAAAALTVTDGAGAAVAASSYWLDAAAGVLTGLNGFTFGTWPYTVACTWGLPARADYALVVAPSVGAAILDVVADRYQRRSPAATSERAGGGVGVAYGSVGLPLRVCAALDQFRRVPT